MSKIVYIDENNIQHDVKCSNCILCQKSIMVWPDKNISTEELFCKIKELTDGKEVVIHKGNRFRTFNWTTHLIETESLIVKPDFGCVGFKPKK